MDLLWRREVYSIMLHQHHLASSSASSAPHNICVYCIAGSSPRSPIQSAASLRITSLYGSNKKIDLFCPRSLAIYLYLSTVLRVKFQTWSSLIQHLDHLVVDILLVYYFRAGPPGAPIASLAGFWQY